MEKITFEDATLEVAGKVTIDGTDYPITEAQYTGGTDLNANTFNTMQDNIEVAIKEGHVYSTEEQVIGTWFGKPLYRKVIDCGSLPNASTKTVNTLISNIDMVTNIYGFAYSNSTYYPLPYVSRWEVESCIQIAFTKTANVLEFITGSDRSSLNAYAILEYTKTTD